VRLKALQDLRTQEARAAGLRLLAEVLRRSAVSGSSSSDLAGGEPPLLDPEQDMKVGGAAAGDWDPKGGMQSSRPSSLVLVGAR
jgi:hypothetical protein